MEFELFATKANVQELKVSLKLQSAEHVVAQHETKKNLRFPSSPLLLTLQVAKCAPKSNTNPALYRLTQIASELSKAEAQLVEYNQMNELVKVIPNPNPNPHPHPEPNPNRYTCPV